MIRTKLTKLHLSPISLSYASSVRILRSANIFRDMLPTIRLSPLGSFKEAAISLRNFGKSILEGNLYLGPLEIIF